MFIKSSPYFSGLFSFSASEFDKDGNGLITAEELRQALNNMNSNADDKLSEFEATQLVQQADADGDSLINYNGILDAYNMLIKCL